MLCQCAQPIFPNTVIQGWGQSAVTAVAGRYATALLDVVDSVRKMEDMFKRLNANAAQGGISGSEKISTQVVLDLNAFVDGVVGLGVVTRDFASMED